MKNKKIYVINFYAKALTAGTIDGALSFHMPDYNRAGRDIEKKTAAGWRLYKRCRTSGEARELLLNIWYTSGDSDGMIYFFDTKREALRYLAGEMPDWIEDEDYKRAAAAASILEENIK